MEFMILNRTQITKISPEVPHVVISITETEKRFPTVKGMKNDNKNLKGVLRQKYTDEDDVEDAKFRGQRWMMMSDEQAREVLDFVDIQKDDIELIVCQCDGGVCRSSATAAALSVILNGSRTDNWIFQNGSPYVPNMYVYRKILVTKMMDELERIEKEK